MNLVDFTNSLLKKFKINIDQILRCSDNTMEDIKNEAFIVVFDNFDSIKSNERLFINKLKSSCLKFNKYGKRIESKERFNRFNEYENRLIENTENTLDLDEDLLCSIMDVKNYLSKEDYDFLIEYYGIGCEYVSDKYNISKELARKRVSNLLKKIRDYIL